MRQNIFSAFKNAILGIWSALLAERNMKIHFLAAAGAVFLSFRLHLETDQIALVILCIAGVLATELLNTAIESVVDLISPQYHKQAQLAKDTAAGAVLIMAAAAAAVGYIVFIPKLWG